MVTVMATAAVVMWVMLAAAAIAARGAGAMVGALQAMVGVAGQAAARAKAAALERCVGAWVWVMVLGRGARVVAPGERAVAVRD